MADYPFRVNMQSKNGLQRIAFMTASLVTDTDAQISASVMVEKINLMPSASYEDGVVSGSSPEAVHLFGGGRNLYLSCSVTDPNVGAIEFNDTESTSNEGLDFYTFWGTKVCSVLGLPEGIPIYTENFKLSDDSNDPDNYISGDIVAGGVSIKDSLKLSPQARVRSNFNWDEEFGEGLLQWASGSGVQLRLGYDNVNDKYVMTGPVEIDGSPLVATSEVQTTFLNGQSGDVRVRSGQLDLLAGNRSTFDIKEAEAQISMTSSNRSAMRGHLHLRHNDSDTWSNSLYTTDYTLALVNRHGDATGDFAGIAFDVGSTPGSGDEDIIFSQAIGAGIIAERDSSANTSTTNYDTNLSFATNDAGISGLTKRMTIHHDGFIELPNNSEIAGTRAHYFFGEGATSFSVDRNLDLAQGHQSNSTDGVTVLRNGSITGICVNFAVTSVSTAASSGRRSFIEAEVDIGGSEKFSITMAGNNSGTTSYSTGAFSVQGTQARGTDAVTAGTDISMVVNFTNFSDSTTSSTTITDVTAYVEITYDT